MVIKHCKGCQKQLGPNDFFCTDCGKTVGLDWVWIIYGTTLITGLQGILLGTSGMLFLGEQLIAAMANPTTANFAWVILQITLIAAFGYFLGGVLIGRMSSARTIVEPAIAAGFPAAVFLIYLLGSLQTELSVSGLWAWSILFSVLVAAACFGVALLGGYWGEKWQRYAEKKSINPDATAKK